MSVYIWLIYNCGTGIFQPTVWIVLEVWVVFFAGGGGWDWKHVKPLLCYIQYHEAYALLWCFTSHLSRGQTLWLHEKQPLHFLLCVCTAECWQVFSSRDDTEFPSWCVSGRVMREGGCAGTWVQKPLKKLVVPPAYLTSTSWEARMRILQMYLLRKKPFLLWYIAQRENNSCLKVLRSMEW